MRLPYSLLALPVLPLLAFAQPIADKPAPHATSQAECAKPAKSWEKTVAQDGSGDYKTVLDAVLAAPTGTAEAPSIIRVKKGTYTGRIYIQREKRFLRIVGENAAETIIAYNLNANIVGEDGKPIGTFRTPTVVVDADDFTAENITFANTAGPVGQALAIRLDGDRLAFHGCRFLGWQDTILTNRGRHFFKDCYIEGHVDFIFGAATAFFQGCHIHCLGNGYVTAASTPEGQPHGYIFRDCRITGAKPETRSYLGRPWRIYAQTLFINTEMSEVIRPEGWNNWGKKDAETTTRYAEFGSRGPGADQAKRAPWAKPLSDADVAQLTPEKVLAGDDGWKP